VMKYAKTNGLFVKRVDSIMSDLIDRLAYDEEFGKRQQFVGMVARFIKQVGFLAIFRLYPFYFFQPYMHLVLTRDSMSFE